MSVLIFIFPWPASTLTMENVPWHEEVLHFVKELTKRLPGDGGNDYEISCEHEHSNCVLVTHKKFKNEATGGWNTWIDYPKFHRYETEFKSYLGCRWKKITVVSFFTFFPIDWSRSSTRLARNSPPPTTWPQRPLGLASEVPREVLIPMKRGSTGNVAVPERPMTADLTAVI